MNPLISPTTLAILIFDIALALYILASSLYYFYQVKSIWRWIKLIYAINAGLAIFFILDFMFGWFPLPKEMQVFLITMLLSTIASGLIVAQAKLSFIKKGASNESNH